MAEVPITLGIFSLQNSLPGNIQLINLLSRKAIPSAVLQIRKENIWDQNSNEQILNFKSHKILPI